MSLPTSFSILLTLPKRGTLTVNVQGSASFIAKWLFEIGQVLATAAPTLDGDHVLNIVQGQGEN